MLEIREIVKAVLFQRTIAKIKVRQPLASLQIPKSKSQIPKELLGLIKEETNIKKITFGKALKLDTKITQKLREEGMIRELIRNIQKQRKNTGLKPKDKITVEYSGPNKETFKKNKESILKQANIEKLILVGGEKKLITIKKI